MRVEALDQLEMWLDAIEAAGGPGDRERTIAARPAGLSDGCFDAQMNFISETLDYDDPTTACNQLYPYHSQPRAEAGMPLLADVRARSSRSEFVAGGTTQRSETDVYQLAVLWQAPGAPVRAALGRQYVAGVSSVLLLDGALVEFSGRRAGVGVFGGLEPAALEFDASVQDYGAFVRLHGSPGAGASRSPENQYPT